MKGDSLSCRVCPHFDTYSRFYIKGCFPTKQYACACVCECVCVYSREGIAPRMAEQLWSWVPRPISQQAPRLLIHNWLAFPASAADTHSQLVLSETEPGPRWERDREERQRHRGKTHSVCVAASNYLRRLNQSKAKERDTEGGSPFTFSVYSQAKR